MPCARPEDARQGGQAVEADGAVAGDGGDAGLAVSDEQRRREERRQRRVGAEAGEVLVLVDLLLWPDGAGPSRFEEAEDAFDGRRAVAGDAFPAAREHGVRFLPFEHGGDPAR